MRRIGFAHARGEQQRRVAGTVSRLDRGTFGDETPRQVQTAPLGGIDNTGWKLVYTEEPNLVQKDYDETGEGLDLRFSLGIQISTEDGRIRDVRPGSPAATAVSASRWFFSLYGHFT